MGWSRSLTCSRGATSSVVYKHMWHDSAAAPRAVRGLHHHRLACEGRGVPERPRRVVRHLDVGPVDAGGSLRRVRRGLHRAVVLGPRRERPVGHGMGSITSFLRDGSRAFITYSTTGAATRRSTGPWASFRHDAVRAGRGMEGQAGGVAFRAGVVLVLAIGRRRKRDLGTDQPCCAAVEPPGRHALAESLGRSGEHRPEAQSNRPAVGRELAGGRRPESVRPVSASSTVAVSGIRRSTPVSHSSLRVGGREQTACRLPPWASARRATATKTPSPVESMKLTLFRSTISGSPPSASPSRRSRRPPTVDTSISPATVCDHDTAFAPNL